MAAIDEDSGRRTRRTRNAPVVPLVSPTTRRTRKTTAEEVPIAEDPVPEAPVDESPAIDTKEPTIESPEEEQQQPETVTMTVEEDDSNDVADEDQFIHIPDGNGVANNGIEHIDDVDMVEADKQQEESVPEGEMREEKEEAAVPQPTTAAYAPTDVVMASHHDPSAAANALKRKIGSGDGDDEVKKQKTEDGLPVAEAEKGQNEMEEEEKEEKQEVKPPPKLPELEKYWKPVIEDSTNFTGWTYLLQYVDQETDVDAAREAYNAFLGHYPYCYGYWRKYADYEKTKGDKSKCQEVFERGLKAIPLSVDLWIHYLNYVKASHPEDEAVIRGQYERALDVCGLEFRSDKLWEAYIKWETEAVRLQRVVQIYDRLLATPTLGYKTHIGGFGDFVRAHPPKELLAEDTLKELRAQVTTAEAEKKSKLLSEEEIDEAIRKRMIGERKKIHAFTVQEVTNRWTFEEAVKRPYFHVKPLERCQLKNWTDYLDYEIECGDRRRIVVLFERCLIACALYEEYWEKFVRFLEDGDGTEEEEKGEEDAKATKKSNPRLVSTTRDVFERACTIHHKEKPRLHLMWSSFEECQGNIEKAAQILGNIDEVVPNLLQIEYRRINVERRRGNFDKCEELFKKYVVGAKNQHVASSLVIKHARFVHKIRNDLDRALTILRTGQTSDPTNVRIPLQMIDMAMQRVQVDEKEVMEIMEGMIGKEELDAEQRFLFAQRRVEFLEDYGDSPRDLEKAHKALQVARKLVQEEKKQRSLESNANNGQTNVTAAPIVAPQQQVPYSNYNYYGSGQPGNATSSYGSYSESNYYQQPQQYAQNAGNNYYANYYQ